MAILVLIIMQGIGLPYLAKIWMNFTAYLDSIEALSLKGWKILISRLLNFLLENMVCAMFF